MWPVSFASERRAGEHGVHGASDSSGAGVGFKDIDNRIDQTGAGSVFENSKSQSENTVSSMARGQVKRSATDIQRGSHTDRVETPFEKRIVTLIYKRKF